MLQSGVRTSGALFGRRCSGSFILNGQFASCDFAKQTLMRLRSLLMWCLLSLQPFCSLIQIHGHNRARQRDKLGHILEEFATLQDEVISCWHFFFFLLKTNFPATLQSLTLPLCSTGREGGRSLAQPADETRAAAAASSVPRHLDPVSQPADHDPVPAQWLRTGALQHARVLLHLLVRLYRRVLRALWLVLFPVKAHKSCLLTF